MREKATKNYLEGKAMRQPIHVVLVHVPIALFILSFLLDIASFIHPEFGGFVPGAFHSMVLGTIMALLAAIPGFVDYTDIRADHPAKKYGTMHMILNLLAVGVYAVNIGIRFSSLQQAQTPLLPFVLSCAGIFLLSISGYLGGVMVYDNGIGVGRHRRRTRIPERTIKISSRSAPKWGNFVQIAAVNDIGDQETLRVDVDGVVMTVARLGNEFVAFQEFCTHRCGPLSEGSFHNGQIQCPWHGSCFDMRTGKVMKGPAKIDLRTFEVEIREGKIFVAVTPPEGGEFIAPPKRSLRRFFYGEKKERR